MVQWRKYEPEGNRKVRNNEWTCTRCTHLADRHHRACGEHFLVIIVQEFYLHNQKLCFNCIVKSLTGYALERS